MSKKEILSKAVTARLIFKAQKLLPRQSLLLLLLSLLVFSSIWTPCAGCVRSGAKVARERERRLKTLMVCTMRQACVEASEVAVEEEEESSFGTLTAAAG